MAIILKLRILTWKYLYFRKYYFMTTLMEIVLPILLVYFVLKIGHNFTIFVGKEKEATYGLRTEKTMAYYQKYTTVYYTPDDLDARLLMIKCMRRTFDSLTVEMRPNIISTKTEAELLVKLLSNSSANVAGVVLLTVYPVLRYKIRDLNSWKTDDLFSEAENEHSGPYEADPYFDTGFAPLQAAINLAFICLMENKDDKFYNYFLYSSTRKITSLYEPFPYPEYTQTTSARAFVPLVVGFVIILCSLIQSGPIIGAIIVEKQSGLKEWMKMAGLEEKLLWFSWFINSVMISSLIYTVVTFLLIYDLYGDNTALLRYIEPSLLWVCVVFFCIAQISFSFFFCALFHQSTIATASLAMITLLVAFVSVKFHDWRNALLLRLALLCPSGALMQSFIRFTYFELLGFHLVALIFDTFLYFFLTYYISNINPGRYGFRKPWYFITGIRRPTFSPKREIISEGKGKLKGELGEHLKRYIEPGSSSDAIDLQITNLRKTFNFMPVLRDVNLSVHNGEILVLLGHNGAGKTTLLSILTGLTPPTEGSIVFKENLDVINKMEEFRMHLGTCPQEDRLFPYLSVADHLIFFGMLKGASYENVKEEAQEYLKLMELIGRGDELPYALPASLRRKLSLSIALMGKAEVLILDEPTAGIDDLSKRRIWKLLKKLKKQRTIIMTSNVMKEAAQVGDRIAILNNGSIACNGSVDFLKQTYGSGYQLKITRKDDPKAYEKGEKNPALLLIQTIFKGVVGSKIESRTPTELSFYLPSNDTAKFPALFKSLESKKNNFNIQRLGVSYTTLDQIFLKVVSQSIYDTSGNLLESGDTPIESIIEIEPTQNKYTRKKLLLLQHIGMFKKKLLFLYRNRIIFTFRV